MCDKGHCKKKTGYFMTLCKIDIVSKPNFLNIRNYDIMKCHKYIIS